MGLVETLNWRYAAKSYNGVKVPRESLNSILEAARLAPTSSGLEPFEIIVVSNPELKAKMKPIAFNQNQLTECSDVLVFAAWDHYTPERINSSFDQVNEQRGTTSEGWEKYRQSLLSQYPQRDPKVNFEHAARQAYIAFGIAIAAAAELKIDSTPMEGFNSDGLDELLGLKARGLKSVVILPIGYRNVQADWLANLKKVRRPMAKVVTMME